MKRIYTDDCPYGVRILPMVIGNSVSQHFKREEFKGKTIEMIDVDSGEVIDKSDGLAEAASKANVHENTLWKRIDRKIVKNGKIWRYAE